jgi:ribosomal protein L11 methyltransferase
VIALVLTVPASEAELAADMLWSLGVLAVEERTCSDGTQDDLIELWTSLGDDTDEITRAADAFPDRWRWHLTEVDDAVVDNWRAHAVPTWVTEQLVITPAWVPVQPAPEPGVTVIAIEPGATFGLGDHPTTVLTLRAMAASLTSGATVLDVGCGSGVLSIAAVRLGASTADAIDVSPAAVPATQANAAANGVADRVHVSTTPLAEIDGVYDVVLANILAPALIDLSEHLRRVTAPDGVLIVSGVLADRVDHVLAALAPMQVVDRLHRDGWGAVSLRW